MACSEIAALRLGLMNLIGIDDPSEKQHELDELGDEIKTNKSLASLSEAATLNDLKRFFESSLTALEEKHAHVSSDPKESAYYKTLLVMTKKIELDLENHVNNLKSLYDNLEEVHDYIHEVYPVN